MVLGGERGVGQEASVKGVAVCISQDTVQARENLLERRIRGCHGQQHSLKALQVLLRLLLVPSVVSRTALFGVFLARTPKSTHARCSPVFVCTRCACHVRGIHSCTAPCLPGLFGPGFAPSGLRLLEFPPVQCIRWGGGLLRHAVQAELCSIIGGSVAWNPRFCLKAGPTGTELLQLRNLESSCQTKRQGSSKTYGMFLP